MKSYITLTNYIFSNTITSNTIIIQEHRNMRVTTKGQVTIPQYIREKYSINPNTEVDFIEENNRIVLIKKKSDKGRSRFQRFRGIATVKMTTEEILSLTRGK